MASVRIEKSAIESAVTYITKYSNEMKSQLTELYSVISGVKEIWQSNSQAIDYIDGCSSSVKSLNSDYDSWGATILQSLQQMMAKYELEDARTSMRVSSVGGMTVATMAIGAGGFSTGNDGFDFTKVSKTANDAANGICVEKVNNSAFGEGEYTFQYRNDGTVRIDKNGTPMAFTTKENADRVTGGIGDTGDVKRINNSEAKINANDGSNVSNYECKPAGDILGEKGSIKLEQADGVYNSLDTTSAKPLASDTSSTLNTQPLAGVLNEAKESQDPTNWQATFTPNGVKN